MGRSPCCDKDGLKKGPWTPEEDQKLVDYIQKHGYGNWRTLPKNAGLQRCGKSCRLRWTNYLRPDIKRGRFSFEEEESIIQLHSLLGNKWSAIAARLPGRTDNEVKNYWNTHIRKRLLRMGIDPVTHSPRLDLLDLSSILSSSLYNPSQMNMSRLLGIQPFVNPELLRLATSLLSSSSSSSQPQPRNNQNFFLQNAQENQVCNPQVHNQFEPLPQQPSQIDHNPILEIPTNCTTSFTSCDQAQLMEPNNVEQLPSTTFTHFSSQNSQISEWQESNGMPSDLLNEDYISPQQLNYAYYCGGLDETVIDPQSDNSALYSNNGGNQNFSFTSVFSTPSSSPTPINSNSTCINGSGTEDEKESYCSSMLKFEIPDIWDVNEFM